MSKQSARKDLINVDVNILLITLGFIGLMVLLSAIASVLIPSRRYKASDAHRAQHHQDGDGHTYNQRHDGTTIHESASGVPCLVEHVPDQRNSGELQ